MEATADTEPKDTQNNAENTLATTAATAMATTVAPASEDSSRSEPPRPPPEERGIQQSQSSSVKPNKVYIGGLPDDTREADLQDCFGKFGTITSIELKTGYGFVSQRQLVQEFNSRAAAEKAVAIYHEGSFLGNIIRVELSHGGGKSSAKLSTEPGACFRCGQHGHWARECPNHTVVLQRRSWTDRSASHGGLHSRSDSFKSATAAPLQPLRDDYRSTTRRQDDYSSGGRDYGLRDREPRRPGSPYYDYNRAAPAVTHGYDDRRYPPAPTRPAYPPERPPSPYGVSPRATGTLPPSRDYVRGYDRSPASYDTRAIPPHVSPYADSSSYTRRSDAYPSTMQNMHGNQPYPGYPSTRGDYNGRRSPPPAPRVGGRYQEYNGPSGYDRPYERRRSASPVPAYREGGSHPPITHPAGNGYSRANAAPYGRSHQYSPAYTDRGPSGPRAHGPHTAPMVNSNANSRVGDRDYRPYRG